MAFFSLSSSGRGLGSSMSHANTDQSVWDDIRTTLDDRDALDWTKKRGALDALQALVLDAPGATAAAAFTKDHQIALAKPLVDGVLLTERSALVTRASELLQAVAVAMGAAAAPLFERIGRDAIVQAGTGNKTNARNLQLLVVAAAQNVPTSKWLEIARTTAASTRSDTVKEVCLRVLNSALGCWDDATWARIAKDPSSDVAQLLLAGLTAGRSESHRRLGRISYRLLEARFPSAAAELARTHLASGPGAAILRTLSSAASVARDAAEAELDPLGGVLLVPAAGSGATAPPAAAAVAAATTEASNEALDVEPDSVTRVEEPLEDDAAAAAAGAKRVHAARWSSLSAVAAAPGAAPPAAAAAVQAALSAAEQAAAAKRAAAAARRAELRGHIARARELANEGSAGEAGVVLVAAAPPAARVALPEAAAPPMPPMPPVSPAHARTLAASVAVLEAGTSAALGSIEAALDGGGDAAASLGALPASPASTTTSGAASPADHLRSRSLAPSPLAPIQEEGNGSSQSDAVAAAAVTLASPARDAAAVASFVAARIAAAGAAMQDEGDEEEVEAAAGEGQKTHRHAGALQSTGNGAYGSTALTVKLAGQTRNGASRSPSPTPFRLAGGSRAVYVGPASPAPVMASPGRQRGAMTLAGTLRDAPPVLDGEPPLAQRLGLSTGLGSPRRAGLNPPLVPPPVPYPGAHDPHTILALTGQVAGGKVVPLPSASALLRQPDVRAAAASPAGRPRLDRSTALLTGSAAETLSSSSASATSASDFGASLTSTAFGVVPGTPAASAADVAAAALAAGELLSPLLAAKLHYEGGAEAAVALFRASLEPRQAAAALNMEEEGAEGGEEGSTAEASIHEGGETSGVEAAAVTETLPASELLASVPADVSPTTGLKRRRLPSETQEGDAADEGDDDAGALASSGAAAAAPVAALEADGDQVMAAPASRRSSTGSATQPPQKRARLSPPKEAPAPGAAEASSEPALPPLAAALATVPLPLAPAPKTVLPPAAASAGVLSAAVDVHQATCKLMVGLAQLTQSRLVPVLGALETHIKASSKALKNAAASAAVAGPEDTAAAATAEEEGLIPAPAACEPVPPPLAAVMEDSSELVAALDDYLAHITAVRSKVVAFQKRAAPKAEAAGEGAAASAGEAAAAPLPAPPSARSAAVTSSSVLTGGLAQKTRTIVHTGAAGSLTVVVPPPAPSPATVGRGRSRSPGPAPLSTAATTLRGGAGTGAAAAVHIPRPYGNYSSAATAAAGAGGAKGAAAAAAKLGASGASSVSSSGSGAAASRSGGPALGPVSANAAGKRAAAPVAPLGRK